MGERYQMGQPIYDASQTYLGTFEAGTRELYQSAGGWQKIYMPLTAVFTDAIVFIQPPLRERLTKAGAAIFEGVIQGFSADSMVESASTGVEGMKKQVNERFHKIGGRIGAIKFRYTDLIAEFGNWAQVWPNDRVAKVTMKKMNPVSSFTRMGTTGRFISIKFKPTSGLTQEIMGPISEADNTRACLTKAFHERFIDKI
jgi:hypothetical protein